jgi:hypothetical protein
MEPIASHGEELLKMGGLVVGPGARTTLTGISTAPDRASYHDCTRHAVAMPPRPCDPGTAGEGIATSWTGLRRSTYRTRPLRFTPQHSLTAPRPAVLFPLHCTVRFLHVRHQFDVRDEYGNSRLIVSDPADGPCAALESHAYHVPQKPERKS